MTRRKAMADIGDDGRTEQHWHVNRGIPVMFIFSSAIYCVAQIAAFVWYASQFSMRVDAVEKVQSSAILVTEKIQAAATTQGERLTRVEEKLENVKTGIGDIKAILSAQDARTKLR